MPALLPGLRPGKGIPSDNAPYDGHDRERNVYFCSFCVTRVEGCYCIENDIHAGRGRDNLVRSWGFPIQ